MSKLLDFVYNILFSKVKGSNKLQSEEKRKNFPSELERWLRPNSNSGKKISHLLGQKSGGRISSTTASIHPSNSVDAYNYAHWIILTTILLLLKHWASTLHHSHTNIYGYRKRIKWENVHMTREIKMKFRKYPVLVCIHT